MGVTNVVSAPVVDVVEVGSAGDGGEVVYRPANDVPIAENTLVENPTPQITDATAQPSNNSSMPSHNIVPTSATGLVLGHSVSTRVDRNTGDAGAGADHPWQ